MAGPAFHLARRRRHRRANREPSRQLRFEPLESRHMLATFLVSNLNDAPVAAAGDQPGTLRQAIFDANHSTHSDDPDIIAFSVGLTGDINLSVVDDLTFGPTALVVTSSMRIQGNGLALTIKRDSSISNLRVFLVAPGADLTIDSLMLSGGVAKGAAGAAGQNGGDGLGGAVYNQGSTTFIASTLYANSAIAGAPGTGGAYGLALGGAVYNDGGTVSIHNSTVSGNSTSITGGPVTNTRGGGIYSKAGTLNIYNSTITDNSARSGRDLYVIAPGNAIANINIYSSIVARADVDPNFLDVLTTYDQTPQQIVVQGANNLLRRHTLPLSVAIATSDPLLGSLANNGGPTLTHALLSNSPAFGLGSNLIGFSNDQRGPSNDRMFLGRIDIGAFELQSLVGPSLPGDYNRNQTVDAADYVVWRKNLGRSVTQFTGADGNGNAQIDAMDYVVWRAQFGATSAPAPPIVEPIANVSSSETAPQFTLPTADTSNRTVVRFVFSAPVFDSVQVKQTSTTIKRTPSNISSAARQTALLELLSERQAVSHQDSSSLPSKAAQDGEDFGPDECDAQTSAISPNADSRFGIQAQSAIPKK